MSTAVQSCQGAQNDTMAYKIAILFALIAVPGSLALESIAAELSRAPAPVKALAVNNAVGGSLPSLTAAACPLVMKTNTQITPFPIRTDDVCGSFGLGLPNNLYACAAFGQLGSILGNPDLRCAPDAIPQHPDTDTAGGCCWYRIGLNKSAPAVLLG